MNENPSNVTWFGRGLSFLLRLFFRLLYNEFAWTYDWVAAIVSVGNWIRWVQAALPYIKKGPVLELGHGPGHLQQALISQSVEAYGLDASPQMVKLAAKKLLRGGQKSRLTRALSQAIPFPDSTFNTVVATFPSEYIIDPQSLREIWRALLPGGRLVILPFAWITGGRPIERAAAWLFQFTHQSGHFPVTEVEGSTNDYETIDQKALDSWFGYFAQPARQVGFQLTGKILNLDSSAVALIIAYKPTLSKSR
jgi:ubiquinone/menaquinone biosynthesis C-methylase UbiE